MTALFVVRQMIHTLELESGVKPISIKLPRPLYCALKAEILSRASSPIPNWQPNLMVDGVHISVSNETHQYHNKEE